MSNCQEKMLVYSRVVGYYSPTNQWNKGKQEEFRVRKTFKLGEFKNEPEINTESKRISIHDSFNEENEK